jgi:flagellar M-ring protein FliF
MAAATQIAMVPSNASPSQVLERAKQFWAGRTARQKMYLGAALAVAVVVLGVGVQLAATPTMKPLMTGLEPTDAQSISSQLTAKKIPYVVTPDGTSIDVPADQLDAARVELASHDQTHSGRMGYEIFDKASWGQTEFDEKVNYQRALEGELERTLQTMSNVKSARVHLVMASNSVFLDRDRGAKASITLRLKHGTLTREQLEAVARLVSGAVDQLKPSDVSIVDADTNQSLGIASGSQGQSDSTERELAARLVNTLSPVVGADHLHASVNVEYETGSTEENQEKYDPAVSAPLNMQHSEEHTIDNAAAGGVPGTSTNVPSAQPAAAVATPVTNAGQSSKTDSAIYGVNKTTRHTVEPAGSIRRLTAAVLVDDVVERKQDKGKWVVTHHQRTPEQMKLIGELAQAAIGYNSVRGDVVSVRNLAFEREEEPVELPPTVVDKVQKSLEPYGTAFRYAGMVLLFALVYLLMVRPIQKKALAGDVDLSMAARQLPGQAAEQTALPEQDPALLKLRSSTLKKQLTALVQAEPETSTTAVRAWLKDAK